MKLTKLTLLCTALTMPVALADPASEAKAKPPLTQEEIAKGLEKHRQGAKKLSTEQDELSADVQDLIDEQTDPKMIKLLREIETVMADATDLLEKEKTGGSTIAIETEVIEKIFEAAKQKQQKGGGSKSNQKSMSSMLKMLQNMMEGGKDVGKEQKPGGKKPGNKPGQGGGGGGKAGGKTGGPDNTAENSERRVPKSSGNSGTALPREFQKAMDAYNKGAAKETQKP